MNVVRTLVAIAAFAAGVFGAAQQPDQIELKIEPSNRTLAVSADARVTVDPDIAILHIGFATQPLDAKSAYAEGSKISNQIVAAIKQSGVEDSAIRSESQSLEPWEGKNHKFRLQQSWVVRVPPARAAEILDIAITAGATNSGEIEWTVNDEKALDDRALEQAALRARSDANVMVTGIDAKLGRLIYMTNHIAASTTLPLNGRNFAGLMDVNEGMDKQKSAPAPALAIEPHKVSRTASVYAVFAIE